VTLLFVGRLEERKGVRIAIDALRQHNARALDRWTLIVAGDGPERRRLETQSRGDDNIVFLGQVDDATKRSLMRRAHVLIAPSTRGESFGLILLEAMASEVTVVASDIEGYRVAASSFATFFERGNADSLEAAIGAALVNESAERIRLARLHAERWSMSALIDEYEERYEKAAALFRTRR
jgi:phosphatidylinositol alpha-mannosyltransferase